MIGYFTRNNRLPLPSGLRLLLFATILSGMFSLGMSQVSEATFEPKAVINIEYIQPFSLKESFQFNWQKDHPTVDSGLLVVIKVDPDLVIPRDALEPVLYAGNHTVQRLNNGHESGFVIGIIPEQIDLSKVPIWFGTPQLPERIDAAKIESERSLAEASEISPLPSDHVESRTQDAVSLADLSALLRDQAASLLLEFSPQEKRLADSWRLTQTGL